MDTVTSSARALAEHKAMEKWLKTQNVVQMSDRRYIRLPNGQMIRVESKAAVLANQRKHR